MVSKKKINICKLLLYLLYEWKSKYTYNLSLLFFDSPLLYHDDEYNIESI